MATILIIDDEASIREVLKTFLRKRGYTVAAAATGGEGLTLYFQRKPDVVILDIRLPDLDGLEVLKRMYKADNPAKVIMITAFHDMRTTIRAMKDGAYDYVRKPLDIHVIDAAILRALQVQTLEQDALLLEAGPPPENPDVLIGQSQPMLEIFKQIGLICQNRAPVLIQGETGVGKELIARIIHHNSPYHTEPFITFDCSAIVETLIESELFGHEKGAFTGAHRTSKGKIEMAGRGTLFLDEIGELPLHVQGALLGFLQRREYMRVGGRQVLPVHCRILAATNRELRAMVQTGAFREDLYYRLNVVTIHAPALRERKEDIPALARHFLHKADRDFQTGPMNLEEGVLDRLADHPWPGNVRELENLLVEAAVNAHSKVILVEDIDRLLQKHHALPPSLSPAATEATTEKDRIVEALKDAGGVRYKAAEALGLSLPTLRKKMSRYGL